MYLSNPGLAIGRLLLAGALGLFVPGLVDAQPATTRVSVGPGDLQSNETSWVPAISADGRWVAFESGASNLVAGDTNGAGDVFVHDRQTGTTIRASVASGGTQANGPDGSWFPAINADGSNGKFHGQRTATPGISDDGERVGPGNPIGVHDSSE